MMGAAAFFSFAEIRDESQHAEYNQWHQLDHRPENLALPGVRPGERWVRPPEGLRLEPPIESTLAKTQYVTMYWFREPVDASIREWQELAEQAFQWGRRPDLRYVS